MSRQMWTSTRTPLGPRAVVPGYVGESWFQYFWPQDFGAHSIAVKELLPCTRDGLRDLGQDVGA